MLFFLLAGLICSATANSMLIKHDSIWMLDIDAIGNHEKYVVDFHPVEKRISLKGNSSEWIFVVGFSYFLFSVPPCLALYLSVLIYSRTNNEF